MLNTLPILASTLFFHAGVVEISSPQEWQVLQRDEQGFATLSVDGLCDDGIESLGLIVKLESGASLEWKACDLSELAGPRQHFSANLRVPAGSWHSLLVSKSEKDPALASVAHFGVGEVFVIAGQSNSTNSGEERTVSGDDRVVAFDGEHWTLAKDPMPGVQDGSQGGSPWPVCGHLLSASLQLPVAFASVGYGGTSIRHWQPNHELILNDRKLHLYEGLRGRVESLGHVRAILWHQGESDAAGSMKSEEYVELFKSLQSALRKDTGCEAPWIVARASFVPELAREKMDAIRNAQAQLWKMGLALQGPDTDDLQGSLRHSKDHIHFSKAGLEVHAARWYAMVWTELFAKPGSAAK